MTFGGVTQGAPTTSLIGLFDIAIYDFTDVPYPRPLRQTEIKRILPILNWHPVPKSMQSQRNTGPSVIDV